MSNQMFKETYDPENGDHDLIACEIITECLEIPGVREAVILAAHKEWNDSSVKWLDMEHGVDQLGDIPFQFIWDYIFNQEDPL